MPRTRDETRVNAARALASKDMPRKDIAAALGVSERTIARWLGRPRGRPVSGEPSRTTRWRRGRRHTIKQAVALIDTASPDDLAGYLARTSLHDHVKASPAILRDHLATGQDSDSAAARFGAWKAAQQLLQAAGLPY